MSSLTMNPIVVKQVTQNNTAYGTFNETVENPLETNFHHIINIVGDDQTAESFLKNLKVDQGLILNDFDKVAKLTILFTDFLSNSGF